MRKKDVSIVFAICLHRIPPRVLHFSAFILLVGECSAFLASGSDPTDERCMKHGPQTTPRRGRSERTGSLRC